MHPIKNISERNKIDTQSRTDAPKSVLETEKTLKTLSSGQIYKKPQKPKKKQKTPKKTTGLVFFQPCLEVMEEMEGYILEAGEGEVDEPRHAEPLLIQTVLHLLHQRLHHLQQFCTSGIQLDQETF
jgi:hypothetical protein